jgi:hypothetical protein
MIKAMAAQRRSLALVAVANWRAPDPVAGRYLRSISSIS